MTAVASSTIASTEQEYLSRAIAPTYLDDELEEDFAPAPAPVQAAPAPVAAPVTDPDDDEADFGRASTTIAPSVAAPRIDLIALWQDQTATLPERQQARILFFEAGCQRGIYQANRYPIRQSARSRFSNPMVGQPAFHRVDVPRRACDTEFTGKIYEQLPRKEAYDFHGQERTGTVIDVYDLGLNAAGERLHIGTVRNAEGQPFTNEQDGYDATLRPGGGGWLQDYWIALADKFAASPEGQAARERADAFWVAQDKARREAIAAAIAEQNDLADQGAAAVAAGNTAEADRLRPLWKAAKAKRKALEADYFGRPQAETAF
jgi:hypothetical protein